jgi:SulP family sulfate permease
MNFSEQWLPESVRCLRAYSRRDFGADLLAGVTVGLVALPLAMAFGIASGVTPQAGLYTAIVAGGLISALGGSRMQIGGPTGAFVVIVAGIIAKFGMSGLALVTLMAGAMLVVMGLTRLGAAVKFIPRARNDWFYEWHSAAHCLHSDKRLPGTEDRGCTERFRSAHTTLLGTHRHD